LDILKLFQVLGTCMTTKSGIHLLEGLATGLGNEEVNEGNTQK
jgi:hypothetical protein